MDKLKAITIAMVTALFTTITVCLVSAAIDRETQDRELAVENTNNYPNTISVTDIEENTNLYGDVYCADVIIETASDTEESLYKIGSRGEYVKILQSRLIGLGFLDDVADGIYGSKTAAAVAEFQRCIGVEPDGEVDYYTAQSLFKVDTPHAPNNTASDKERENDEYCQTTQAATMSTTFAARTTDKESAVTFASTVPTTAPTTQAAPAQKGRECEPNDSAVKANKIELNDSCIGNLSDKSDDDWYYIELESSGKVSFVFSHDLTEKDSGFWKVCFFRDGSLENEMVSYLIKGYDTEVKSCSLGLPAGKHYFSVQTWNDHTDMEYRLRVGFESSFQWETEGNNDFTKADRINTGSVYYGALTAKSDKDYYSFSLNEAGKITVDFCHEMLQRENYYWKVQIFSAADYEKALFSFMPKAFDEYASSCDIGLAPGEYYMVVRYATLHSDVDYSFKVSFSSEDDWEREINDSFSNANNISVGNTYYGSIMREHEHDWYSFTLESEKTVSLSFTHDLINDSVKYWRVYVCKADDPSDIVIEQSVRGKEPEVTTLSEHLPAGDYLIRVSQSSGHSDYTYSIRVNA